jgi:hypothetical protein
LQRWTALHHVPPLAIILHLCARQDGRHYGSINVVPVDLPLHDEWFMLAMPSPERHVA